MADKETGHDVFDGEIPKNVGKKEVPLWLKGVGLAALVGVLGSAAYMLEADKSGNVIKAGQNEVADALIGRLPNTQEPAVSPMPEQSAGQEISIDLIEPAVGTDISPNELAGNNEMTPGVDIAVYDDPEAAITITPPSTPIVQQHSEVFDTQVREDVEALASRIDEIERSNSERITVVKSGIDIHNQSLEKLSKLVSSLESLKTELATLKTTPISQPTKTAMTSSPDKPNRTAKTVKEVAVPELKLLGVDTWGGERFAQIEHKEQIHLLARHESIGKWRIETINSETVIVKNREGETFELQI